MHLTESARANFVAMCMIYQTALKEKNLFTKKDLENKTDEDLSDITLNLYNKIKEGKGQLK